MPELLDSSCFISRQNVPHVPHVYPEVWDGAVDRRGLVNNSLVTNQERGERLGEQHAPLPLLAVQRREQVHAGEVEREDDHPGGDRGPEVEHLAAQALAADVQVRHQGQNVLGQPQRDITPESAAERLRSLSSV